MRTILLTILILVAALSTAGGVLLLSPALTICDIRPELSAATPFGNYIFAGLFLLITISNSSLIACYCMCMKTTGQYK